MESTSIRPRIPQFDDDDVAPQVPAAKVSRKPPPAVSAGAGKSRFAQQREAQRDMSSTNRGERFEIPLDDAPIANPPVQSMVREIKEKNIKAPPPLSKPIQHFPKSRPQPVASTSKPKESRFKASLKSRRIDVDEHQSPDPMTSESLAIPSTTPTSQLQHEIDEENRRALDAMSEDEILEEQARLRAMLGGDRINFLLKRHSMQPSTSQPPGSPGKGKVRFNEEIQYSNPPSRSPSPVQRRAIILPSSDDATIGDWLHDPSARVDRDGAPAEMAEAGTPEDIRRRFFPDEPMSANLDWMQERISRIQPEGGEPVVKFDLQGKVLVEAIQEDHTSDTHRHASGTQAFSLAELVQLARSTVQSQRAVAMQILVKAATTYLADPKSEAYALLVKSDSVNAIIGAAARGLVDRNLSVVTFSISLIWLFATNARTTPNTAAAILISEPPPLAYLSRLLSPTISSVELSHASMSAIVGALHALSSTTEDFISAEIVEAHQLLEHVCRTFLEVPHPPSDGIMDPSAHLTIDMLVKLVARSRSNAEQIISRRLEQSALRYIAVPPWSLANPTSRTSAYQVASDTLDLFCEYAHFGLGCANLSNNRSIFRDLEGRIAQKPAENERFARSWFALIEAWSTCAIDPHSTVPEHDILWAETKEWGEHALDVLLEHGDSLEAGTVSLAVQALCSWLQGAAIHDKPAFEEMQKRLEEVSSSEKIQKLLETAAEEPITEDKAKLLLAIKRLVQTSNLPELLGAKSALLDRIQVEEVGTGENTVDGEGEWM